jgi:hypothetical protein
VQHPALSAHTHRTGQGRAMKIQAVSWLLILALLGCGGVETVVDHNGGGVETTTLVGIVEYADGKPAAGVKVLLRTQDHLANPQAGAVGSKRTASEAGIRPDTVNMVVYTDDEGRYRFTGVKKGGYVLEYLGRLLQFASLPHQVSGRNMDSLPLVVLRPAGNLSGQVLGQSEAGGPVLVQVYGLDQATWTDSITGHFRMVDLPAGTFSLRFSTGDGADTLRIDDVVIRPDSTTVLPAAILGWTRSDTYAVSSEGSVPSMNLARFPLLIRLDSGWSGFAEARPDGADLRVVGPRGRLPLEIAAWDPGRKSAQLWVLLDSLPSAGTLDLRLLWGRASAASVSNGRAVFDTSRGFAAVAHLESGPGWPESTTGQAPAGTLGGVAASGRIGDGLRFRGNDRNIHSYPGTPALSAARTLAAPEGCTFSLWLRPAEDLDTITTRRTLLARGFAWGGATDQDWALWIEKGAVVLEGRAVITPDSSAWARAILPGGPWEKDRWYHLALVHDGKAVTLLRDGQPLGAPVPYAHTFMSSDDNSVWSLGLHHPDRPELDSFDGILDEVRIQRGALSQDWLRACVLNQGPANGLVTRKP